MDLGQRPDLLVSRLRSATETCIKICKMTKISGSISHGSIPVAIFTLLSILYIRLFSNAQNAIVHIATEKALGKHAHSTLAGQCHQTLRLCSPLYANRLDGPAQRLRP